MDWPYDHIIVLAVWIITFTAMEVRAIRAALDESARSPAEPSDMQPLPPEDIGRRVWVR